MLCQICGQNEAKYTCPQCGVKSCSLNCVKKHKLDSGCSGIRPKTEFVPLEKMDGSVLLKDCALIDRVNSEIIRADDNLKKMKKSVPYWKKILKKQCKERGITLHFMPNESSRAKENKTKYKDKKTIFWTCKFRFRDNEKNIKCERIASEIDENALISDIIKGLLETTPNDFVANLKFDQCTILLLAEGAVGGGYYEVDLQASLSDNLFSKTIIEYPIFEIVSKDSLNDWKIVSILDVKNVEKPKEKIQVVKQEELPSYEMIKDALKLDIITKVISDSKRDEQANEMIVQNNENLS